MAFTFEIVTHGGFDLVRDIWVFVASIFGSTLYQGLLTAVFLLSLVLAAAGGFLDGLLGGRLTSVGSWVRGFFIAIFFYYTFMTGNASVQIYDDVSGQTHLQSGVPVGIAMMAGLTNKVAVGLEDMITSFITTPVSLSSIGYERGIKMLQESYDGVMKTALATQVAPQAWDSANNYVSDCVAIEAVRSSAYRAQIDQNTDVLNAWSLAANRVLYTYTGLDVSGNPLTGTVPKENVSCAEAWNRLNAYFSSADWDNVVNKFCNMMSFDASDPASLAACKTVYENTVREFVLGGTTKAAEDIAKNIFAGKVWNNFLSYLDNSIEAARAAAYARVSSELSGIGIMAQEWIPVIKVMIFVLIVGLVPLVAIFMVTPYAVDAFKFLVGLFCWWLIWCALDRMMMVWWLNKLYPIFEAVSDGGKLGAAGVTQLWTLASKSLSLLGNLRSFGMLIASALMFSIVKLGGSAFAHLSMGLGAAAVRGSGAQTAAQYISPEERAWDETMRRVATYNREIMAARMAAGHYGIESGQYGKYYGGIDNYYGEVAYSEVTQKAQNIGFAHGVGGPAGALGVGEMRGSVAEPEALNELAKFANIDQAASALGKDRYEFLLDKHRNQKIYTADGHEIQTRPGEGGIGTLDLGYLPTGSKVSVYSTGEGTELGGADSKLLSLRMTRSAVEGYRESAIDRAAAGVRTEAALGLNEHSAERYGVSREFAKDWSQRLGHNLEKQIANDESLSRNHGIQKLLQAYANHEIGTPKFLSILGKLRAGGYASFETKDGQKYEISLKAQEREALSRRVEEGKRETVKEMASSEQSREQTYRFLESRGYSDEVAVARAADRALTTGAAEDNRALLREMVKQRARSVYGDRLTGDIVKDAGVYLHALRDIEEEAGLRAANYVQRGGLEGDFAGYQQGINSTLRVAKNRVKTVRGLLDKPQEGHYFDEKSEAAVSAAKQTAATELSDRSVPRVREKEAEFESRYGSRKAYLEYMSDGGGMTKNPVDALKRTIRPGSGEGQVFESPADLRAQVGPGAPVDGEGRHVSGEEMAKRMQMGHIQDVRKIHFRDQEMRNIQDAQGRNIPQPQMGKNLIRHRAQVRFSEEAKRAFLNAYVEP